nr:MFS transporter [Bacillus thuringiensis]
MTIITCFFQGIILFLVGHVNHIWLIVSLFALIGLLETAVNVIAPSVNHTIIPPKIFGRVISILILVMSGSIPISQAIAGYLMKWIEPNTIFIYAGVLEISAAVMVFSLPFVRNYNVNQKNTTN